MKFELFAFYGGPDQIMGLTSGLAVVLSAVLIFWNKLLVTVGKILNYIRPSERVDEPPQDTR